MSGAKHDVIWSPTNPNRFLTFGTDLRLYEVSDIDVADPTFKPDTTISDKTLAKLLSINSDHQYMKCVAWFPKAEPENLLAVGQSNGKVVLTSFGHLAEHKSIVGREFIPRHARQCNCVAWNPVEHELLASGLEKNRADCGILIWNISNAPVQSDYMSEKRNATLNFASHLDHHPSTTSTESYKPHVELGHNEICHSLQWFQQPKTLVSGMNNKHLKIFDLRDCSKHQNVCATKSVYGVCVDPYYEHRLASFVENQVMIWDIRNFEKPVVTLNEAKPVIKLSWSSRRCNLLASLSRESYSIKLYDIQQTSLTSDDIEPTVVERMIKPYGHQNLSSFSWHPSHENRLLSISHTNVVRDYTIFDRITLNWAPTSELVWTHGKKLLQYIDNRSFLFENLEDISVKMRVRALLGYGLKSQQLSQNGEMAQDNPPLSRLWNWLDTVKGLQEEGKIKAPSKSDIKYEGIYSIICGNPVEGAATSTVVPNFRSEEVHVHWQGLERNLSLTMTRYRSEERDKALLLCGWGGDAHESSLNLLLDRLEVEGQYSRAAAIAIFNIKLLRAITILKKGAQVRPEQGGDPNLYMVAMALSGFSENSNSLWQEMCQSMRVQLQNPYLRAAFSLLTCAKDHYDDILAETGLAFHDKVAFACLFLNDAKLVEFISTLTSTLVELGDLDGILLTGVSTEGLNLLQSYVDRTGDVQTASLVVLQSQSPSLCDSAKAKLWVNSYRELLDGWRLWQQRGLFDTHWFKTNTSLFPQQQMLISCNYCGKSITSHLQMMGHGQRHIQRFQIATSNKIMSCPGCRKPLPRCTLCMTNMGTQAGTFWKPGIDQQDQQLRLTKFSNWFTWCQSCRHGGHSSHIIKWFDEHSECPVTGCNCKCMSLDSVAKVPNLYSV